MKQKSMIAVLVATMVLVAASLALAGFAYAPNKDHLGGNIEPAEAYKMIKKDPDHTFLVDCRTRAEYQFVGHPEGAVNIPLRFLSTMPGQAAGLASGTPAPGAVLTSPCAFSPPPRVKRATRKWTIQTSARCSPRASTRKPTP